MTDSKLILGLNRMTCYKEATVLEDLIWNAIASWSYFEKDTIGKQLARSADSVSANIAEGFGREGIKDKIKFYIYARASALETINWLHKTKRRGIISPEYATDLLSKAEELPKLINFQIFHTKKKL